MESDNRELLRTLERAEAAPFVDYPRTPRWLAPVVGLWCAVPAAGFWLGTLGDSQTNIAHTVLIDAVLLLVDLMELVGLVMFLRWCRKFYGVNQYKLLFARKPREILRAYWAYYLGALVLVGLIAGIYFLAGWIAAIVVAFMGGTLGYWIHDKSYAQQAAKVKARLGDGL